MAAGIEDGFADVPRNHRLVAARGGGELFHLLLEGTGFGENLAVLAYQREDLQSARLPGELGPGPEPGLAGVADDLVAQV